jgi:arabinose-5-phosphate isomerase
MESQAAQFMALTAEQMMSRSPKSISPEARLAEAEALMNEHKITSLLVMEQQAWVGVLQIYDL